MSGTSQPRQQSPVVVVGLDCITGLQTARVFFRRGIPVIGVASDPSHFCCRTRACQKIIKVDCAGDALIERLVEFGQRSSQKPLLVPCSDNGVLRVAEHVGQLREWYHVALPAAEIVEMLTDKVRFPLFAEAHGLPVPKSYTLSSLADARAVAMMVTYPAVIKPPIKTLRWQEHTNEKGVIVKSTEQLLEAFERCSAWSETLLLQEWIPGPLENHYTCDAYFDADSQPLVTFTSQKLRQWPVETGVGSISQECDNPTVRDTAIQLFQAADFQGLAYVEMKRHEATGEYLIIEPNVGRPTGRSTCAEAASVAMLYTMYCDVVGLPLPHNRQQTFTGKKWIYWKRDLRAAWHCWRQGELKFTDWLKSISGHKSCAVFSWSDPIPFLADWLRVVKKSLAASTRGKKRSDATSPGSDPRAGAATENGNALVTSTTTSESAL